VNTSTHPLVPRSPLLTGLGQALRWLRERQARKQYRVAADAGITKGMLSAYETGRQRPSLDTLDKLLEALRSDLNDLHNALQIVNGRPDQMKGWRAFKDTLPADRTGWPAVRIAQGGPSAPSAFQDRYVGEVREGGPPEREGPPGGAVADRAGRADQTSRSAGAGSWGQAAGRSNGAAGGEPPDGGAGLGDPLMSERVAGELYSVLGYDQAGPPLAPAEQVALGQMLEGFHNLLRFWHRALAAATGLSGPAAPAGGPPIAPGDLPGRAPAGRLAAPGSGADLGLAQHDEDDRMDKDDQNDQGGQGAQNAQNDENDDQDEHGEHDERPGKGGKAGRGKRKG